MTAMMDYWRSQLSDALTQLEREPFTASRNILRERIDNYRAWIAQGEAME